MIGRLDTVLLKTASRCNLACNYCYVYESPDTGWERQPKRMSHQTIDAVVDKLKRQADRQNVGFAVVLHGGEPLLVGYERLHRLLTGLRSCLPPSWPISVQTNGTLLDEEMVELFAETDTSVSISIDGPQSVNDLARVDRAGSSSFRETLRAIELIRRHTRAEFLFAGTLAVVQLGADPVSVYSFLKSTGTRSMDFLLQDGNHDRLPRGKASFDSTEYGEWLARLFDEYIADPDPPRIRLLDDFAKLCLGGRSQKEGSGEDHYGILIVDTDGRIQKNDTLKSSFDGADLFRQEWNVGETELDTVLASRAFRTYARLQSPTSPTCKSCSYLSVCGGGMPLYRWSSSNRYDNPSVYCADHRYLVDHIRTRLSQHGVRPPG